MMPFAKLATPWWLGGVALAAAGVIVARVVAPALGATAQRAVEVAGELLAFGGLAVIAFGMSRRRHRDPAP